VGADIGGHVCVIVCRDERKVNEESGHQVIGSSGEMKTTPAFGYRLSAFGLMTVSATRKSIITPKAIVDREIPSSLHPITRLPDSCWPDDPISLTSMIK
jgi:hypothetical protein